MLIGGAYIHAMDLQHTSTDAYKLELLKFVRQLPPFISGQCWLWPNLMNTGYGHITTPRTGLMLAHRYAYELLVGPIPTGSFICHHCDVPACVNPEHHFIGTRDDNMRDAVNKGRMASWKKLTREQCAEVRSSGDTYKKLGARFGVSTGTIFNIRHGVRA